MSDSGHTGGIREFVSHSAGAVAVVCGLFFLLAFMYIGGTADPQAHARHIPVAVVNSDEAATLETPIGPRRIDVGTRITAGLIQNNDWGTVRLHMVDPATAEAGLRDGTYFGALRIPADLSEGVVGLVEAAATEAGRSGPVPGRARVELQCSPRVSIVSGQVMNTRDRQRRTAGQPRAVRGSGDPHLRRGDAHADAAARLRHNRRPAADAPGLSRPALDHVLRLGLGGRARSRRVGARCLDGGRPRGGHRGHPRVRAHGGCAGRPWPTGCRPAGADQGCSRPGAA